MDVWTYRIWLQVFGFLLGIDLKGMSGGPSGAGEDGEEQMKDVPTPPPATQAQGEAQQAKEEEEEEEVRCLAHNSVQLLLSRMVVGQRGSHLWMPSFSRCSASMRIRGCVG